MGWKRLYRFYYKYVLAFALFNFVHFTFDTFVIFAYILFPSLHLHLCLKTCFHFVMKGYFVHFLNSVFNKYLPKQTV